VIESVKAAADIYAPLSGQIVAINDELSEAPEKLNEDPYAAWMFRIRPDNAAELEGMLDAAAYRKLAESEKH
jgi:glycine cleavage system H protein